MRNKKGYLLPIAIILVLLSTIMGMSILYLGGNQQIAAIKRYHKEKAFYIAEAGINMAFAYKKANESWHPEQNPVSFGGGTFRVTETAQGETIIFTSEGSYKGQSARVSIVTYRTSGTSSGGSFSKGIFGNQGVMVYQNAWIDGYDSRLGPYGPLNNGPYGDTGAKLGPNSEYAIWLFNNAHIYGRVMVEDPAYLYLGKGCTVTEKDLNHEFEPPFNDLPDVIIPPDLAALTYPIQGDPRIAGNYTLSSGKFTVLINKSATILGGNFRFKTIKLENNATLYISGNTRLYVEQGMVISNNSKLELLNNAEVIIYLGTEYTGYPLSVANNAVINNPSASGNLRIYGQSFLHAPPGIYYHQNYISVVNNASIVNAVIYAPGTHVNIYNNGQIFGGVVAGYLTVFNNASVHYDIALRDITFPEDPGAGGGTQPGPRIIVRWTKPDWLGRLQ